MGKRDDKITRAAHIKRHTKGTSNEISFSVLDAAKNALDGEDASGAGHGPRFGGVSLFTLPGRRKKPAGTPTKEKGLPLPGGGFASAESGDAPSRMDVLPPVQAAKSSKQKRSPEEEIARRKARRRLSRVLAASVVIVVSVGLLGAGGTYLYHDHQRQQSNVSKLDEALGLVKQADETLTVMNAVVNDPFSSDSQSAIDSVRENLDSCARLLDEADVQARAASVDLRSSKEKEAANQAVAAISARRALVESGTQLLAAAQVAEDAAVQADDAWDQVLEGDSLARDAAKLVTDTTAENVQASKDRTNEALAVFQEARAALANAQVTYPEADLTPVADYIDKRIEALGYAIASDDAILAKNKEDAAAQNNAYNTADSEAAALAKELPAAPSSILYQAFEQATADLEQSYSTARSQAATADSFIRDYLGTDGK